MAKPSKAYYEHYKRQHRVLGNYLMLQCWINGCDAVLVSRETLAHFHDLKNFTDEHISWLRNDVKPYFPHSTTTIYTKTSSKFAGLALSRIEIPPAFGRRSLTDEQRASQWRAKGFRVAALTEFGSTEALFTERDAVASISLIGCGLIDPPAADPLV